MENLLTEKDLLIFSACTSIIILKDMEKLHRFIEETLHRPISYAEFGLQSTYDECKSVLREKYLKVLEKMNSQAKGAIMI